MSGSSGRPPLRTVVQVAIATGPQTPRPVPDPAPGEPPAFPVYDPGPPEVIALCSDSTMWVEDPADPTGWHLLPMVPGTGRGS